MNSARSIAAEVAAGHRSALDALAFHAGRVERLDGQIGAFVRLNPAAADEAAEVDRRVSAGEALPLAGVPIAIKDNLCTAGVETTCASRMLEGFVPQRDATAVRRLRRAGAVVLGKTNLDEFGMGSSTENSGIAPTRNPWDRSRVPGGSSGGSAAAVAAGFVPLALGSDTGGSVRQPAAFCGVVGLKPSYGRVSRSGLVAFGSSLDQVGPLAADVADAALLLSCVAGADREDMTCSRSEPPDYAAACSAGASGLRIGLPREYRGDGMDAEVVSAVEAAAEALERVGARVEPVSLPHTRFAIPAYYLVATAEASSNLARFDGMRYGRRVESNGLHETYRASRGGFGAEVRRRIMLGTFALSAGYHDAYYGRAQQLRLRLRQDFTSVFESGVDVLLTPVTPTTAFALGEKRDDPLAMYLSDVFTAPASLAGLPALSVPLGLDRSGLPLAAQLIGPDLGEPSLFRVGAELERAFPPARSPMAAS